MRLLTRADFDGLGCAVLLAEVGIMDNWMFVHPKDVQDGKYPGDEGDILANIPYIPGCGYWFDHHSSEQERLGFGFEFKGSSKPAKSCARVIWEYFGGHDRFGDKYDEMLHWVDKVDSGELALEEIENPEGWVLLGFIMDPRTGLGRYRHFTLSNYQLMENLIGYLRTMSIDDVLQLPDVVERVELYHERDRRFREMIQENSRVYNNVLVLDLRPVEEIQPGNRFVMYALHPKTNISIQVIWGMKKQNTVFSVGHSILNRTSSVDVGSLLLAYGGGGHQKVGTCQVANDKADKVLGELIKACLDR
jgi:nanoRNase/pAp phosphatase (c-di-AMP/oligoRNAs hydrolase)